jgi:hypothetical protein
VPRPQPVNVLVMEQAKGRGAELLAGLAMQQTGFEIALSFVSIPEVSAV